MENAAGYGPPLAATGGVG